MIGRATPCCDRILGSDAARAVGIFRPNGPLGYVARSMPEAPLRATRAEAEQDQHFHLSPQCNSACDLEACTICTACYHGNGECKRTIKCPTTGETKPCRYAPKESS